MRLPRSRAAVVGALSAAVLVAMPVAGAAPAGAANVPGTSVDDPTPSEEGPTQGAEQHAAATLELVNPEESPTPLDGPVLALEDVANDVGEPVVGGPTLDLQAGPSESESDSQSDPDADADPAAENDDPTADGDTSDTDTSDTDATSDGPATGVDENESAPVDQAGGSFDSDQAESNQEESVRTNAADAADTSDSSDSATADVAATAATTVEGLPDSGAASGKLAGLGLALTVGGLLVAGSGRHRRSSTSRRAERAALGI